MISLRFSIIFLLLLIALACDLLTYKIKNYITYSFMLIGLIVNLSMEGFRGMLFSLQGIMLPVICLMVLYVLRIIGAGDIKLLSAIGAVMGSGFILFATMYSFICGGFIASVVILIRRNGLDRIRYLLRYIKSCFISMDLLEYADFKDKMDGGKFHFSIAVASGTITEIIVHSLWV